MTTPPTSPFLQGAFTPVHHESTAHHLPHVGEIPPQLDGLFTQIGPTPLLPPRHTAVDRYPWFTQDGLVCGVRVRGGRAEWFRNRWIRSRRASRTLGERRPPGPRHFPVDTVHTNLIAHNGLLLALVETGCLPARLNSHLDTVEYTDLAGRLPRGFSAHPKLDPATGDLHVVAYSPLRTWAEYLVLAADSTLLHTARIPLDGRPMLHDIALAPHHVLFFDAPVRFSRTAAVRGVFPYRWDAAHQNRIGVLPRPGTPGTLRWFDVPAGFVFHTVGAHEPTPTTVELTAIRYDRLFDGATEDPLTGRGHLWTWTLDLTTGRVHEAQLADRPHELPRSDPRRLGEAPRYYYAVTADSRHALDSHQPDALLKHDFRTRTHQLRKLPPGTATAEAVFVPAEDGTAEDQGWLLHFAYDTATATSTLVCLDARDITARPLAVVELPTRVPLGCHSSWLPAADLTRTDAPALAWPPPPARPQGAA
ncbi:dioxygenase [Streptomyces spiroverticillatus]|uniref:Dioxygenase n=1 Tax=Streptomyces finlayi TaxID=67296 RepID=A0A918X8U3_9ACTN|nr:carotenoid oxygenase family protein [Streptomyces finlayi]GHA47282.1 dioxygenase [Streptomyces spiroverticillatus]GHD18596.1 dioxygenase [Streptomyces finlayi]